MNVDLTVHTPAKPRLIVGSRNPYLQVIHTYLTRRLLMGFVLLFIIITYIPVLVAMVSPNDKSLPLGFSAFLAFPAMFLGAHVKQQLATPEATVVPGYRRPHLVVALGLLIIPICSAALSSLATDDSFVAHFSICLLVWSVFFRISVSPGHLAVACMFSIYLPALLPPLRGALLQMLDGSQPGLAWSLLGAGTSLTVLTFLELVDLSEDDLSYGNTMPMNAWDLKPAEQRRRLRTVFRQRSGRWERHLNSASAKLERLSQQTVVSRQDRRALISLGTDMPMPLRSVLAIALLMEVVPLLWFRNRITTAEQFALSLHWPVLLSMTFAWSLWLPQIGRWPRLGYESLRPATRREWIIDNGLALAKQILTLTAAWLVLQGLLLLIFLYDFRTSPAVANAVFYLAGMQVLMFGVGAWLTSFGSMLGKFVGLMLILAPAQGTWMAVSQLALNYTWHIPTLSATIAVIGIVFTRLAYRRWCRIDLV